MKKTIFSIFLVVLCFIPKLLNAATLHLIVVYQNDSITYAWKDKMKMLAFAKDAACLTEMGLKTYVFTKDISKDAFKNEINNIKCESDDVIWFYYSGHGHGEIQFPVFLLDDVGVGLVGLHNKLKEKAARLTITSYESCNHYNAIYPKDSTDHSTSKSIAKHQNITDYVGLIPVLNILFRKSAGDIMMCSTLPSELSWGAQEAGGYFTHSLIKEFLAPQDTNTLTWHSFFQNVKARTSQLVKQKQNVYQVPYSEMQVTRDFPLIKGKEIGLQKIIYVESPEVEIGIRDNQKEDGDSISMVFQQKLFLENRPVGY